MKRKFLNQSGSANKFWNITLEEETQIIHWGKIGTKGRESIKHFSNPEKCLQESQKLINQKLKKGYKGLFEGEDIIVNEELSEEEKAEYFFWTAIRKSNKAPSSHWSDYDVEEHIENLILLLSKFEKQNLILFEKVLREKLNELYLAHIAELDIILTCSYKNVNGEITFDDYLSTDGFIYFRCWLLLKGKDFFEDIRSNINSFSSGRYSFNIGDTWAEGLLSVVDKAYTYNQENDELSIIREAVSELFPNVIHYDSNQNKMDRSPQGGKKLQKMYPGLVNSICELRDE